MVYVHYINTTNVQNAIDHIIEFAITLYQQENIVSKKFINSCFVFNIIMYYQLKNLYFNYNTSEYLSPIF